MTLKNVSLGIDFFFNYLKRVVHNTEKGCNVCKMSGLFFLFIVLLSRPRPVIFYLFAKSGALKEWVKIWGDGGGGWVGLKFEKFKTLTDLINVAFPRI